MRERQLPHFLVIGAMKSGTTTLHADLAVQSGIFMSSVKEPNDLLVDEVLHDPGRRRYERLFDGATPTQRIGESSTRYSQVPTYPGVPARAASVLGKDLRLVYLLRDPVQRSLSHHRHLLAHGGAPSALEDALLVHPEIIQYSQYDVQLRTWHEHFGLEQILLLRFEDYVSDRRQAVQRICAHIGVRFEDFEPGPTRNASGAKGVVPAWLRWLSADRGVLGVAGRRVPRALRRRVVGVVARQPDRAVVSDSAVRELRARLTEAVSNLRQITNEHWWDGYG